MAETIAAVKQARVCVVSLPLVNEWTQDRCSEGRRTPRWRGITALQELQSAGVSVAMASDNTRDQFYQYGDLDMLEVFAQGVRLGQLDRPISAWPASVTAVPAEAMHLSRMGKISPGGPAGLVLFRARKFSELFSRPQTDRVCTAYFTTDLFVLQAQPNFDSVCFICTVMEPFPKTGCFSNLHACSAMLLTCRTWCYADKHACAPMFDDLQSERWNRVNKWNKDNRIKSQSICKLCVCMQLSSYRTCAKL